MNRIRGTNSPERTLSVLSVSASPAANTRPVRSRSSPVFALINEATHSHKYHNQLGHHFRATVRFAPYVGGKPLIIQVQYIRASEQTFAQRNILGVSHFPLEPKSNSGSSSIQATLDFLLWVSCLLIFFQGTSLTQGSLQVFLCQLHVGISP